MKADPDTTGSTGPEPLAERAMRWLALALLFLGVVAGILDHWP